MLRKILINFLMVLSLPFLLKAQFILKSISELRSENFIKQNYEESCGAASLATLLNLFSFKKYKEEDILKLLNQKTTMLSFLELQESALKLGFQSKAYFVSVKDFEKLQIPVITRVQKDPRFPHFVVVENLKGDFLRVSDPNFGIYLVLKSEFYSMWEDKKAFVLLVLPKDFKEYKFKIPVFFKDNLLEKTKIRF